MKTQIGRINVLTIFTLILTVAVFFNGYFSKYNQWAAYEQLYSELMYSSNAFNSSVQRDENSNSNNSPDDDQYTTPMFYNAKSAVLYAWTDFQQSSSYEIYGKGTGVGSSLGQNLGLVMQAVMCKWPDGSRLTELTRFQTSESVVNLTRSDEYFIIQGKRYQRKTENLTLQNNTVICNYETPLLYEKEGDFVFWSYVVNEKTILKDCYYYIVRNPYTNRIEGYNATVLLNTVTATDQYTTNIDLESKMIVDKPTITKLEFNCFIDRDGHLKKLRLVECYDFPVNLIGQKLYVTLSTDVLYEFLNLNGELTKVKPVV